MYSNDDVAYAAFAVLQSGVWPDSVQGWATLVVPLSVILGAFIWVVNHFVIGPLKADVQSVKLETTSDISALRSEARKSVRSLRRTVQTFVGKVDILDANQRECSSIVERNGQKMAGVEARITQVEAEFREVQTELRDIKNLIEYKVLEKLAELADQRKDQKPK